MTAPHPLVMELTARQEHLGITNTEVFRTTGIARSTIKNWRAGRRNPRLAELEAYGEALGVRLTWEPIDGWADEPEQEDQLPYGELVLDPAEKWCPGCQQIRSRRNDFHRDRSKRDGLQSACKFCYEDRREQRLREPAA